MKSNDLMVMKEGKKVSKRLSHFHQQNHNNPTKHFNQKSSTTEKPELEVNSRAYLPTLAISRER